MSSTELLTVSILTHTRLIESAEITALVSNRVFEEIAPPNTVFPYIIFQSVLPEDVRGAGYPIRIAIKDLVMIKAVGKNVAYDAIDPIAKAIDDLFKEIREEVGDGIVYTCYREKPISYLEVEDKIIYRHRGGFYRMMIHNV